MGDAWPPRPSPGQSGSTMQSVSRPPVVKSLLTSIHRAVALVADVGPVVIEEVVGERGVGRRGVVRRVEARRDRHALAVVARDEAGVDRGVVDRRGRHEVDAGSLIARQEVALDERARPGNRSCAGLGAEADQVVEHLVVIAPEDKKFPSPPLWPACSTRLPSKTPSPAPKATPASLTRRTMLFLTIVPRLPGSSGSPSGVSSA